MMITLKKMNEGVHNSKQLITVKHLCMHDFVHEFVPVSVCLYYWKSSISK